VQWDAFGEEGGKKLNTDSSDNRLLIKLAGGIKPELPSIAGITGLGRYGEQGQAAAVEGRDKDADRIG